MKPYRNVPPVLAGTPEMAPRLNDREGAMSAERDRVIAAFVAACDQN